MCDEDQTNYYCFNIPFKGFFAQNFRKMMLVNKKQAQIGWQQLSDIHKKTMDDDDDAIENVDRWQNAIGWGMPNLGTMKVLIDFLKKMKTVIMLSVGTGHGLPEHYLMGMGFTVICTDPYPVFEGCHKMDALSAVENFPKANCLFMCWPNYGSSWSAGVLKAKAKAKDWDVIFFIGEWGGCTGNSEFFDILDKRYRLLNGRAYECLRIVGVSDRLFILLPKDDKS